MINNIAVITCSYQGFEQELVSLRNRNRKEYKNQAYLDWRYQRQKPLAPIIFKLVNAARQSIGMVGVVFKPYLVDGEKRPCAVVGDVSVDWEYRGQGLATRLIKEVNVFLQREKIPWALVIPTPAAQKVFAACGWQTKGRLIPHVLPIDAATIKFSQLGNQMLVALLSRAARAALTAWVNLFSSRAITVQEPESFDDIFDSFFKKVDMNRIVMQERGTEILQWRYQSYPEKSKFTIHTFFRQQEFIGYIITSTSQDGRHCIIYDLLFINPKAARAAMAVFAGMALRQRTWQSIRVLLNDSHPYIRGLRMLGFVPRHKDTSVFQTFSTGPRVSGEYRWFLTAGDKDV